MNKQKRNKQGQFQKTVESKDKGHFVRLGNDVVKQIANAGIAHSQIPELCRRAIVAYLETEPFPIPAPKHQKNPKPYFEVGEDVGMPDGKMATIISTSRGGWYRIQCGEDISFCRAGKLRKICLPGKMPG